MRQVWPLDPASYVPHPLHRAESAWPEANCSVDLWIEVLHAAGFEPLAALPCAFAIDLEGDQWTFFKLPFGDLFDLYGLEVFELNVWRPLIEHVEDQLAQRRLLIVEVDACYLPDTAGVTYHAAHVKTSIGIQMADVERRRLGYFHNAGYHELEGDDFDAVFRPPAPLTPSEHLPPYTEVVKPGTHPPRSGRALVEGSLDLLRVHLARRPAENPFRRYAAAFPSHLEWLVGGPLDTFHRYAFATLRQCGSAFALAAAYLRWLADNGEADLQRLAAPCDAIANTSKTLQFKTARVVQAGRPFDAAPLIAAMAERWDELMQGLTARCGVSGPTSPATCSPGSSGSVASTRR
jgi:hypothetical protein